MNALPTRLLLIVVALIGWHTAAAQIDEPKVVKLPADKDGTPVYRIDATEVIGEGTGMQGRKRHMKRVKRRNKLRRNVIKVYPIAKAVGRLVNDINAKIEATDNDFKKRRYLKKLERELKDKHEKRLRSLTMSQGRVLIKLVYRETDNSVYHLVKNYRNSGVATFWLLLGKLFKIDIKDGYDPNKEVAIEQIIREIERGEIERYEVYNY